MCTTVMIFSRHSNAPFPIVLLIALTFFLSRTAGFFNVPASLVTTRSRITSSQGDLLTTSIQPCPKRMQEPLFSRVSFSSPSTMSADHIPSRRTLLQDTAKHVVTTGLVAALISQPALASVESANPSSTKDVIDSWPEVTHVVFMDVRISRADGTFYVRDDDTPENSVFKTTLKLGLFGKDAPTHVERFLSYVQPPKAAVSSTNRDSDLDSAPAFPSYASSLFPSFDQGVGVLQGGKIPSLQVTEFAGSAALQYGGRILPAPLWLEKQTISPQLALLAPHKFKGLLIHKKLDVTPSFGLTTRSDETSSYVTELDRQTVVFGRVLEGFDFLEKCSQIKSYSIEKTRTDDSAMQDAAKAVFDAQRQLFRGAAQSFGDTRVGKVYDGKLLRRVEVTRVGLL